MASRIRPNQNQRSATLPVDDEVEGVITVPYVFDPSTSQWVAQTAAAAAPSSTEVQTLFDYGARTDGNPLYIGDAVAGTLTSEPNWKITKFTYDSSARPTQIDVFFSRIWDNRGTL